MRAGGGTAASKNSIRSWPKCLSEVILQCGVLLSRRQQFKPEPPALAQSKHSTLGCLPLITSSGSTLTFQGIISNVGGNCCWIFYARQHKSNLSLCGCGGGRGWRFGMEGVRERWQRGDLWEVTWAFGTRRVCTVPLHAGVRRDPTLKSNYTTTTSSLIKLRATRLIQLCDPAERVHSSLRRSDIIQSVLQQRTANWWCCYVCGSVSQLQSGLLTSITCHSFQLHPDVTHCVLKHSRVLIWVLLLKESLPNQSFILNWII